MAMSDLTSRQWKLVAAVTARSSDVKEQLAMLLVQARGVAASSKDIEAAKAHLLRHHVRECER